MKHIYEITKIKTQIDITRYDILDDGTKEIKFTTTEVVDGLKTVEELKDRAVSRTEPGWEMEITVAENATN